MRKAKCLVEELEGRELDSYDLIMVCGLIQRDWREVWKRYSPGGKPAAKIDFHLSTKDYFVEMTVETLASLALSPKSHSSPLLIQAVIRRIMCGHRHSLILERLRFFGNPVEDETHFNLGCSVGTMGVDMVVNRLTNAQEYRFHKFGTSRVEQQEQRPLDEYDMARILFLAQYRTIDVLDLYVPQEILNEGTEEEMKISIGCPIGDYRADFLFQRINTEVPRQVPLRGNVSGSTIQQVIYRLEAHHSPEGVSKLLALRGIKLAPEEIARDFTLARVTNDNYVEVRFQRR